MKATDLERSGSKLVLPEKMTIDAGIEMLQRIKKYEDETTEIVKKFNGFPWDAAISFSRAMEKQFGWVSAEATPGFFGPQPPELISVPTSLSTSVMVPLGRFSLPGIFGHIQTVVTGDRKGSFFYVAATVRRKHEEAINKLFALTDELLATESIYRGKAFKLRLKTDNGEMDHSAMPKFLSLGKVRPSELVFSRDVEEMIATNLYTLIEHRELCQKFKVPGKRGILLSGKYGTGKTLLAYVAAKKCTENGWTFLYCERADELADMVKLAHQYQPAVVFCEDIDRTVTGERSVEMDDILNIIDGIESKGTELMVILTTNHVENLNRALLRPGRLDAVINVLPPDAEAVGRLIRVYGRGHIPENADLSEVGRLLEGTIPAVIRECTERAKLSQIKLSAGSEYEGQLVITEAALVDAAKSLRNQLDLLAERPTEKTASERMGAALQELVKGSHNGDLELIARTVRNIDSRI